MRENKSEVIILQLVIPLFLLIFPRIAFSLLPERDVVFIPGILGSKLCEGSDSGSVVWGGSETSLWNFQNLALPPNFDAKSLEHVACGAIDTLVILGVFKFHQYYALYDYLYSIGYSVPDRQKSFDSYKVYEFDYDWRLSNFENAQRLGEFVERQLGDRPFDIVAHSMGGLIARLYIDKNVDSVNVNRLITLGTPHRGAVQALRIAENGWGWWKNLAAGGLGNIRETLLTFPSFYELLPSYNCCKNAASGERIEIMDTTTWEAFDGWLPQSFGSVPRKLFLANTLAAGRQLHRVMKTDLPRYIDHCIIASQLIETPTQVFIDSKGSISDWVHAGGDGTVPIYSGSNGGDIGTKPATTLHQKIFDNDAAKQAIGWCLLGIPEPVSMRSIVRVNLIGNDGVASGSRISLTIDQDVLFVDSEPTYIKVVFRGEFKLSNIDIRPTITIRRLADSNVLDSLKISNKLVREIGDNEVEVEFSYLLRPPGTIGSYEAVLTQEGLPHEFQSGFMVIRSER